MAKELKLKLLRDILSQPELEPLSNKDYFLFMLGTSTSYIHRPTISSAEEIIKKTYENGETLSYAAQVVAQQLNEAAPSEIFRNPVSFNQKSVHVINGPDITGSNVGERIVTGLFLILKAVAEGKKSINISAHSRGAVQAILIAHELDRIKKALKDPACNDKSLFNILLDTKCSADTKNAISTNLEDIDIPKALRDQLG
jgi:hypothetical protein